jgi:hypothetical protein
MSTPIDLPAHLEERLQQLLSAVLIFLGSMSFTVLGTIRDSQKTSADEVFMFIGLASLFAAVGIIDGICDKRKYKCGQRFRMLNRGYLYFSIVVGLVTGGILVLYVDNSQLAKGWKGVCSVATALPAGFCIFMALMVLNGSRYWSLGALLCIGLFLSWHYNSPIWRQTMADNEPTMSVHSLENARTRK